MAFDSTAFDSRKKSLMGYPSLSEHMGLPLLVSFFRFLFFFPCVCEAFVSAQRFWFGFRLGSYRILRSWVSYHTRITWLVLIYNRVHGHSLREPRYED